jgi:hypothetical protein
VRRSFLPFVQLLTAIDFPDSMSFVTSDDLRTWAVTQAEAERAAVANLTSQPAPVGLAGPVGMVMGPDGYASSWLAAPTSLAGVTSERFGPDPVIIAVGRDQVRVVDSTNAEAITAQLTEAIDAYREEPRQLSPVPYLIGSDRVEPWGPPTGHPAYNLVQHAQRLLALFEYERQKSVVQELSTKAGEDVYAGSYQLVKRPDGSVWSWSAWVRQVTNALIPETDYVIVSDDEDTTSRFTVRWSDAVAIAATDLTQDAGYDPPRWRYHGWPTEMTLTELRRKAVDPSTNPN